MNKNVALIFAGGTGKRMGNEIPKQFLVWDKKPIIIQTIEVFDNCKNIDAIIVVSKKGWIKKTEDLINKFKLKKVISVIPGGKTAMESQYLGLLKAKELFSDDDIVLIHDGVRPLIDEETIIKNIKSVKKYGNAITVTKCIETVITVGKKDITGVLPDRSKCMMAKAPQSFYIKDILNCHIRSIKEKKNKFIDSATMMDNYGYKLHSVFGKEENIKITTPSDYYMYLGIVESRKKR